MTRTCHWCGEARADRFGFRGWAKRAEPGRFRGAADADEQHWFCSRECRADWRVAECGHDPVEERTDQSGLGGWS